MSPWAQRRRLGLFLAAALVSTLGAGAAPPPALRLLDDQGKPYGPVDLRRDALQAQADGLLHLTIPRKALLWINRRAAGPKALTLSLYRPQDTDFREPAFRLLLPPGQEELKVPAGDHIASLALAGYAPDLQRLSAQPGGQHQIMFHLRQGWSLVARLRAAATLQPVAGAHVEIAEAIGYGRAEKLLAESVSGPDGLVLVAGLETPMARLDAHHASFIPAAVRGLTASPGSFAFREVGLGAGGRIVAQVTVHGRPLAGAECKDTVRATLLSAAGHPVPGAWVGSGGISLEQGPFLFSETRADWDGAFEVEIPPGPPRLFASGPDCPLSWFDLTTGDSQEPAVLHCPPLPAALELTLVDDMGNPLPHSGVILRRGGTIVPQSVLTSHLRWLGLPAKTDGAGRLVLAGLAPGDYELYFAGLSSESTILGGRREGYLTTVGLAALQTASLQVTLPGRGSRAN